VNCQPQEYLIENNALKELHQTAQSTSPENIGPERTIPGLLEDGPMLSLSRITLEYNEEIRP
jgi:hypothetical protein